MRWGCRRGGAMRSWCWCLCEGGGRLVGGGGEIKVGIEIEIA